MVKISNYLHSSYSNYANFKCTYFFGKWINVCHFRNSLMATECICSRTKGPRQRYLDEGLHPYVLQIYQTVWNNFLVQQDNASIPAIWQGTVCKLVMSYPLDLPSGSRSIFDRPPLGYSRPTDICSYPFPAATFPEFKHYLVEQWQCVPRGGGVQPLASFKHAQKPHTTHTYRWRSYKIWITIYKFIIITCSCLY